VPDLEFVRLLPAGPASPRRHWRELHNLIIATSPLSDAEVEERAGRNHLEVAYLNDVAVGCSTVRPPADGAATVIARVHPDLRRRGFGNQIYHRALLAAQALNADSILTVVLATNEDGLAFARGHGFVETDRYLLPGDAVPFIDLRLDNPAGCTVTRWSSQALR
jgi:ribosomal protein S18 acetylase RimI-like enzyme